MKRFTSTAVLGLALFLGGAAGYCRAQSPGSVEYSDLVSRLDSQEAELKALRARLDQSEPLAVAAEPAGTTSLDPSCGVTPEVVRLPVVAESTFEPSCDAALAPNQFEIKYYVDYDRGFVLRPVAPEKTPFELQINGWLQFRHIGFDRDADSWTDNAGMTRPVYSRNDFELERARLVFQGFALDEDFTYFIQLDGDTDDQHGVEFFDCFWGYKFNDAFELQWGKRKVSASRQWLLTARRTRLVDRPLATDFFRPDRSVGLFAVGKLAENLHYEATVANGYNTANLTFADVDQQFAYAATCYWTPLGDYGNDLIDFDCSCPGKVRMGASAVVSKQKHRNGLTVLEEERFARLADGTRLTEVGALAPGIAISEYQASLLALDMAAKRGGWSANAEAYFRQLTQLHGDGPLPVNEIHQLGFFIEGGKFLVPKKLDANVRYSQIKDPYGNAHEYAAGVNWFPLRDARAKFSFDVTLLDGSPLNNTGDNILVGYDGVLFRTQFQTEF